MQVRLRARRMMCRPGKSEWAQLDHTQNGQLWQDAAKWQYWVDDGIDLKSDGAHLHGHAIHSHAEVRMHLGLAPTAYKLHCMCGAAPMGKAHTANPWFLQV
jgi:hypothetical protein